MLKKRKTLNEILREMRLQYRTFLTVKSASASEKVLPIAKICLKSAMALLRLLRLRITQDHDMETAKKSESLSFLKTLLATMKKHFAIFPPETAMA